MLKQMIQRSVNALGYRIERIRPCVGSRIDVLDLIVRCRYAERGSDVTFIQIGAHDGGENDPVHQYVERYHWRGLLVEPQPNIFARLLERYRNERQLSFENAAIGTADGSVDFYRFGDDPNLPTPASQLAGLDRKILLRHPINMPNLEEYIEVIQVPLLRFSTLLERHGIEQFDVLFVDAEGFDFEILRTIDFAAVRPGLVQYEHRHLVAPDRMQCRALLSRHGYRLCEVDGDTVACALETGPQNPPFS